MVNGSRVKKIQENRIKNGRGAGEGKDYQPFIQAHDNKVASEGWLTRHFGWKTHRIHHTLSEGERHFLYSLEWLEEVVDIREQFPLLPISRTEEIAEQLGIQHAHLDGVNVVMTTDFVITIKTPKGLMDIVRTVKPSSKLSNRTLELFEIERRFFSEQGIDWGTVTESKLPKNLILNVEWMHEGRYLDTRPGIDEEYVDLISNAFYKKILEDGGESSISKICLRSDKEFGIETGTCMFVLKHMLATKRWVTDMNIPIKESKPLLISNVEMKSQLSDFNIVS
ncbi:heteromeric transposase endonuclease subunit TnsA [Schinkia azotoformans]|uniref:Heteromeric transposase endonuclease subunit TnsA n=1 Tax=Schinkia azotoformans LMG 9581 TaxID=1131731 RepID=K6DCX8_SCHAZ|nr:heteromeric transposase endonuclease subunit TnsA [Schinkia azotoformans]EKN70392.1 hypothetical protein BAZO_01292 [Schinkia azotoformans LMG 9581]MEC1640120.1 heteromeric transposase endonuclease subunit TnsA [Schinkia azotoformans]MEC1943558.1 heteromeric transposase endonuclease subunit TnsA [Schinkia azotoformans]